ncbi:hypothetical protein [Actinoallomurus sp. NPDC052274]
MATKVTTFTAIEDRFNAYVGGIVRLSAPARAGARPDPAAGTLR